ncbi:hypothetical protein GCM10027613_14800 [Microlunatus endophyticus]
MAEQDSSNPSTPGPARRAGMLWHPGAAPITSPAEPIAGKLITETFHYDGGRQVTVYVPPEPTRAIVYAGDGQLISQWGGYLEAAGITSTMIVGAHRTDAEDEMVRIKEYSPSFDEDRFAAHERFFVGDVREWVRSHLGVALPAERTAVCGVSAGAELSSPSVSDIPTSIVRSSQPRRAVATDHPRPCRNNYRVPICSAAPKSRGSSRMPPAGPMRCAMQVRMS